MLIIKISQEHAHTKMTMLDSQRYLKNLCLIKYDLVNHDFCFFKLIMFFRGFSGKENCSVDGAPSIEFSNVQFNY